MAWLRRIGAILIAPLEFIARHFKALLFIVLVVWLFDLGGDSTASQESNLVELSLKGAILESDSFLERLEALEELPKLAGVLLVIDSPGGSVAASVEIFDELRRVASRVPLVVYAQGEMASGGYYAGMAAREIIANRGSLIGSIGVIFQGADVSALGEKLGIKEQVVKAGAYKEAGTFARAWNQEEREELERLVKTQYEMFVRDVALARGLELSEAGAYAQGRVFSAAEALEVGLIDTLGTKSDAKKRLVELSGVSEPRWLLPDPWERYAQWWLAQMRQQISLLWQGKIYS